jgi:hypothetical protein
MSTTRPSARHQMVSSNATPLSFSMGLTETNSLGSSLSTPRSYLVCIMSERHLRNSGPLIQPPDFQNASHSSRSPDVSGYLGLCVRSMYTLSFRSFLGRTRVNLTTGCISGCPSMGTVSLHCFLAIFTHRRCLRIRQARCSLFVSFLLIS